MRLLSQTAHPEIIRGAVTTTFGVSVAGAEVTVTRSADRAFRFMRRAKHGSLLAQTGLIARPVGLSQEATNQSTVICSDRTGP